MTLSVQPRFKRTAIAAAFAVGGMLSLSSASAAVHRDDHGNVGYDTLEECVAAVNAGTAIFYRPHTSHPPLKRAGEAEVKQGVLSDLTRATKAASALGYDASGYASGSCDLGVGRSKDRDGVSRALIGKWIPYAPSMPVNLYSNAAGEIVRATMQQCDNNFSKNLPRPLGAIAVASECFANVAIAPRFETRTEQVVKVPATKRYEVVPPTYKTVTEQVLVSPEYKRQIPVAATFKTVTETVIVRPESVREEPIPATYKTVTEQVLVRPESKRIEVIPATYKTVTEQVIATPERKELRVIPATYADKEERVIDRPATTRVETIPPTFKTVTEQVLVAPETVRYEPIDLPMRAVAEQVLAAAPGKRLETVPGTLKTVTERVLVREASKRLETVPAVFETVTERVKVADATREWKRGQAWISRALAVRPAAGFTVGADGKVDGARVDTSAVAPAQGAVAATVTGEARPVGGPQIAPGTLIGKDDDVWCLVEIPERYELVSKQVLKTPATVREVVVPAEYAEVTRQVIDREATVREIEIPGTYQTVTRMVIDVDKLKAAGYKFNDKGDIIATPSGDRVLRAADVPGASASGLATATRGAASGAEGYVREVKVPAVYKTETRQVIDRPASVRTIEVPATYKTVKTRVMVTPPRTEEVVIPATYKTVTRQVVDQPASTREISIPAEYKTVTRQVVDTPASTRKITIPAETKQVTRQVIDQPASVREEIVPAVYKTVTRQVIDQPATTREIEVPAQYETITRQVKVSDATVERRSVLCESNATPAKIREIQSALKEAGFYSGRLDGQISKALMESVTRFQESRKLPVDDGRVINIDTVKALKVSPQ